MIEDLTKPTRPCYLCKHHRIKEHHYCDKYKRNCSEARKSEEEDCFEVDREEVSNKIISIACGDSFNFNRDNANLDAMFKGYQLLEFFMAIEQEFHIDLEDKELEKCVTSGDLIDLVVKSIQQT